MTGAIVAAQHGVIPSSGASLHGFVASSQLLHLAEEDNMQGRRVATWITSTGMNWVAYT